MNIGSSDSSALVGRLTFVLQAYDLSKCLVKDNMTRECQCKTQNIDLSIFYNDSVCMTFCFMCLLYIYMYVQN